MTRQRDLAAENDALALRWAGPFGYAVLQILRRSDWFSEADFADEVRRAPGADQTASVATTLRPSTGQERTLSEADPEGAPDFLGEPRPSTVTASFPAEPPPPPDFYRRATRAVPSVGRAGEPPPPPGRRDTSGRYVRPAR